MAKNKDKPLFTSEQLSLFAEKAPETVIMVEPTARDLEACHDTYIAEQISAQVDEQKNDEICKEWRSCSYGTACMTPQNDETGICYRDEPHRLPKSAFSRDEIKVLNSGRQLVKYSREEKMIWISEVGPYKLWSVVGTFVTYSAAERKLTELKAAGFIETGLDGKIIMTGWNRLDSLMGNGFEFYRVYGLRGFEGESYTIRQGSKNWSICQRFETKEELQAGWDTLLNSDPFALEG